MLDFYEIYIVIYNKKKHDFEGTNGTLRPSRVQILTVVNIYISNISGYDALLNLLQSLLVCLIKVIFSLFHVMRPFFILNSLYIVQIYSDVNQSK